MKCSRVNPEWELCLESENVFLRERIEIMANTISELNNKVKVVDQEKESLLTAVRLSTKIPKLTCLIGMPIKQHTYPFLIKENSQKPAVGCLQQL